jgi:V8-like Glu-specific endopeptidase
MPLNLNATNRQLFHEALLDAFDYNAFAMMLNLKLDRQLHLLAALPNTFDFIVFQVIQQAQMGSWEDKLLAAAREANPTNQKLLAFSQQFGLASTDKPRQELQRIINETSSFLEVAAWRSKLGNLEPKVCRIEIESDNGRINGTGFLVGTSMVLTNYHVIEPVIKGERNETTSVGQSARAVDVAFRFDYKRLEDGTELNKGVFYKLAENNWLVDDSPNYALDQLPPPNCLDYALLRLEGTPGNDPVGGGQAINEQAKRGWLELPQNAYNFVPDTPVFILQHPKGSPLKLAIGERSVIEVNENQTRVKHRTNTAGGSSGSPCFSQNWELIALHHSGDPDFDPDNKPSYNEAIPVAAIVNLMKERGVFSQLGKEEL